MASRLVAVNDAVGHTLVDHRHGRPVGRLRAFVVAGIDGSERLLDRGPGRRALAGIVDGGGGRGPDVLSSWLAECWPLSFDPVGWSLKEDALLCRFARPMSNVFAAFNNA